MKKVAVIGATAVDLLGQCTGELIAYDSNPGIINVAIGGVGHNIALLLAALGLDVDLISPLADDDFGKLIMDRLSDSRFHFLPIILEKTKSPVYLAACDSDGSLEVGVNDFALLDRLKVADITRYDNQIETADAIVLEANLPEPLIRHVVSRYPHIAIYADGVSQTKVLKLKPYLDQFAAIKVNRQELASLQGLPSPLTEDKIRQSIIDSRVIYVVTNGSLPIVFNEDGKFKSHPVETPRHRLTSTGAGDALFAGVIYGKESGYSADQAIGYGVKLARMTFENGLEALGKSPLKVLLEKERAMDDQ